MTAKSGQQMISVTVELPGGALAVEVGYPSNIPLPTLPATARPADLPRLAHQAAAAYLPAWSAAVEAAVGAKLPPPRPKTQRVSYANDRVSEIVDFGADPPASVTAHAVAQKVVTVAAPAVEGAYLKLLTSALASRLAAQHQRLEGKPR